VDLDTGVLILNQGRNVHRPLAAFADSVIEMAIPSSRTLFSAAGRGADGQRTRRRTSRAWAATPARWNASRPS
jgi:hypothetical protein